MLYELDHGERVYLDHNATTPPAPEITEKIGEWLKAWGNPSSIHQSGRGPKALLRQSRQAVADLIGAKPLEIVFTSGGSEANNLAIKGIFDSQLLYSSLRGDEKPRRRYLMSAVEHPSVMKTMQSLQVKGALVDVIPVHRTGEIDLEAYRRLLDTDVALVSVMYANNETGNIFPIKKMAKWAHEVGALFHCDGVQTLGKMRVNVKDWDVDLASFSAHKFYALKGCGVLYCKTGVTISSLIHGGGQERGRRAGTENVLAIASLGEVAKFNEEVLSRSERMAALRDTMERLILGEISGVRVTGGEGKRIPNTSSLVIMGVDGESLLMNLDIMGFSVSTGAACSSGSPEPSPVLLAMGLTREEAQSSLRISLGWNTTMTDIERFVVALKECVSRLRSVRRSEVCGYGE